MTELQTQSDRIRDWPEDDRVTYYTMGQCHHMALALSRLTGYGLGVLWNPLEWHVPPDERGRGGVLELVHVCVIDPEGFVLDVRGRQTVDGMRRAMADADWDVCPFEPLSMERLKALVEDSGNLMRCDEDDVAEAIEVVRRHPELYGIVSRIDPSFAPAPEREASPAPGV